MRYSRTNGNRFWVGSDGGLWRTDDGGLRATPTSTPTSTSRSSTTWPSIPTTHPGLRRRAGQLLPRPLRQPAVERHRGDRRRLHEPGGSRGTQPRLPDELPERRAASVTSPTSSGGAGHLQCAWARPASPAALPLGHAPRHPARHRLRGPLASTARQRRRRLGSAGRRSAPHRRQRLDLGHRHHARLPRGLRRHRQRADPPHGRRAGARRRWADVTGNYPGRLRVRRGRRSHPTPARVRHARRLRPEPPLPLRARRRHAGRPWAAACPTSRPTPWPSTPSTPNRVFVGTDVGVYESMDGGDSFVPFSAGLPLGLVVTDLEVDDSPHVLVAGTYGRGAFRVNLGPRTRRPTRRSRHAACGLTVAFRDQSTDPDGRSRRACGASATALPPPDEPRQDVRGARHVHGGAHRDRRRRRVGGASASVTSRAAAARAPSTTAPSPRRAARRSSPTGPGTRAPWRGPTRAA